MKSNQLKAIKILAHVESGCKTKESSKAVIEAIQELEQFQKPIYQKSEIATAIQEWLNSQDDKNKTIMYNNGKQYTANDLVQEIENQTELGKELEKDIIVLTIDLLFRKKETI